MAELSAEIVAVFELKGGRRYVGVRVEDGAINKGDLVGLYHGATFMPKLDAEVLLIKYRGKETDKVAGTPSHNVLCALELKASAADVKIGTRLGTRYYDRVLELGLTEEDFTV